MKNKKGITLVALIITIIIMLILAVVSINAVKGEGIISYAEKAKNEYVRVQDEENAKLLELQAQLKGTKVKDGSTTISDKSYVGYYADIGGNQDGSPDGIADGIIFVDLMDTKNATGQWIDENGKFEYTPITTSKEYNISTIEYDGAFGKKPVISVKSGSSGNDRFYVMALQNFSTETYRYDSSGFAYRYDRGNAEANTVIELGTGRYNTNLMMQIPELVNDENNLWAHIGDEVSKGWFVPSRAEWSVFGYNLNINNNNRYNCSTLYWSSSTIANKSAAWSFTLAYMEDNIAKAYVRLATTF